MLAILLHQAPKLRISSATPQLPLYIFMEETGTNLTFYKFIANILIM